MIGIFPTLNGSEGCGRTWLRQFYRSGELPNPNCSTWRPIMIHHRPQGFDQPLFGRRSLMNSAAVGASMVLGLRLPLGGDDTGITDGCTRNASIRIDGDGKVFVTVPGLRTGQGIHNSIAMLISDQLDVALNQVHLADVLPKEGSRDVLAIDNSETILGALKLLGEAGATVRAMLTAAAAERWAVNARSCHAHQGEVIHTPTWRKLRYGELTIDAAYRPIPKEVELKMTRAESRPEQPGDPA
jgi:isoquinoline 1-oxidoreductase subunit beta